jgi:deazaflavin-dependent oxidoreductase (nitroreductase family)
MQKKPSNLFISYIPSPTALRVISIIHMGLYRMTCGRLGKRLDGMDILLLATRGRKTGKRYKTPMPYFEHPRGYLLIASNAGSTTNPGWFYNLQQEPNIIIQVGNKIEELIASPLLQAERMEWWRRLIELQPRYKRYQEKTQRVIPLVLLTKVGQ